ncbi:MAG: amidohydrolase family protein [Gemmatimonadetes bacterium]|nr:amidohydrolase family protein [Gemmatimonadota bacterium]
MTIPTPSPTRSPRLPYRTASVVAVLVAPFAFASCTADAPPSDAADSPAPGDAAGAELLAFTGAHLYPGTGSSWIEDATLVVQDGRVISVEADGEVPEDARVVDVAGLWIIPGLIDAHAHVTGAWSGLAEEAPTADRLEGDLLLYARHGVTTVNSLGGIPLEAARAVRDAEASGAPGRARLQYAGVVVTGPTADEARAQTAANAEAGADWIKFRVDDNLGTSTPMPWEAIEASMAEAEARGLPVSAHVFYRADAERLLDLGVSMIGHSVRDIALPEDAADAFASAGACYVPTLAREITTFAYAERPDWFDDPLFQKWADAETIERVTAPAFQAAMGESSAAAAYRAGLIVAQENLERMARAGVPIAMGTDAGPRNRFPGFLEHLELELMVDSGLTSAEALSAATAGSAACLRRADLGVLEAGRRADFVVLSGDPLADIRATREVVTVYVEGAAIR